MNLLNPRPTHDPQQITAIKQWVVDTFGLDAQTTILVTEIHCSEPGCPPLSSVDFFAGLHWNAVNGTSSGCRSNAVISALGRAADAQKRVPTRKSLHLRGCPPLETVIVLLRPHMRTQQYKLHKAITDITAADVAALGTDLSEGGAYDHHPG